MHRETVLPPCASIALLRDQGASHVSLRRTPKIMKVLQGQMQSFDRVCKTHTASSFQGLVAILLPTSIFHPGSRCQRPPCAAVMDTYGYHFVYCEGGPHRIRRHDAHVKLLAGDLAKAARHPVVEERPVGRHRERPDIRALGRSGGTELFDVTICHPLSQARIRDAAAQSVEGGMDCQSFKIRQRAPSGRTRVQPATCSLLTIGGWHPDAHEALCSVANAIAARGLSTFSRARSILFQRHAALLVTNNALCLMLGLSSDI